MLLPVPLVQAVFAVALAAATVCSLLYIQVNETDSLPVPVTKRSLQPLLPPSISLSRPSSMGYISHTLCLHPRQR